MMEIYVCTFARCERNVNNTHSLTGGLLKACINTFMENMSWWVAFKTQEIACQIVLENRFHQHHAEVV